MRSFSEEQNSFYKNVYKVQEKKTTMKYSEISDLI